MHARRFPSSREYQNIKKLSFLVRGEEESAASGSPSVIDKTREPALRAALARGGRRAMLINRMH